MREKIDEAVVVKVTGHKCCSRMAWESPFIVFARTNGEELIWHSDNVESILARFGFKNMKENEGRLVGLNATVENGRVKRVHNIIDL